MKCKKIQEAILTDYLDGQMNEKQKLLIDRHLAGCQGCENFLIYVRKNIVGLFTNMEKKIPSEIVWRRIKESLTAEELKRPSLIVGFFERLKGVFSIQKPAAIFVTTLTFILVASLMGALYIDNQKILNYNSQKTIQEIDYYQELFCDVYTTENTSFGTATEENFL